MSNTQNNNFDSTSSFLILWNNDEYLKNLTSVINNSISVKSDIELVHNLTHPGIKAIIILIELKWGKKYYSDFYGLEIAQRIRREHKITAPIIFCSFLQPESFFYSTEQKQISSKVQILKASGSYFIPLPFSITQLHDKMEETKPLSPVSLIDVIEKCCNPIGTVIDLLHPLKSPINNIPVEEFNNLLNKIEGFITQEQKEILDYNSLVASAINKLSIADLEGFKSEVQQLERNCIELFNSNRDSSTIHGKRDNIPVLLLEDDINNCKKIKEELANEDRNIDVIYFQDSSEALKAIENDTINNYRVVIADWRLYKNNNFNEWQDYQGYKFLEEASKNHLFAPIALTSMNDSSVHEIRNKLSIKVDLYKKEHLINNNNWEIFADIIRQKYNDINDIICSLPSSPTWKKRENNKPSYAELYREMRLGGNWIMEEKSISEESNKLWENFNNHFINENVFPLSEFNIPINNIRNLLIVRRIWFALWFKRNEINKADSILAIYAFLRGL